MMTVVTKVDTFKWKGYTAFIDHWDKIPFAVTGENHSSPAGRGVTREFIVGRTFIDAQGNEICIGLSKQARGVLGLPVKCFSDLQSRVHELENHKARLINTSNELCGALSEARTELNKIDRLTFRQRLKFLFTGRVSL